MASLTLGHEFEKTPGVGDGQGSLACCSPWGHKESDATERLNWTNSSFGIIWSTSWHFAFYNSDATYASLWFVVCFSVSLYSSAISGALPNARGKVHPGSVWEFLSWLLCGYVYMLGCVWLSATPWTVACMLLHPWNFSGKNIGVGCHFFLQGIFLTQGSNPHLLCPLHWRADSLPLYHVESPLVGPEKVGLKHIVPHSEDWVSELN